MAFQPKNGTEHADGSAATEHAGGSAAQEVVAPLPNHPLLCTDLLQRAAGSSGAVTNVCGNNCDAEVLEIIELFRQNGHREYFTNRRLCLRPCTRPRHGTYVRCNCGTAHICKTTAEVTVQGEPPDNPSEIEVSERRWGGPAVFHARTAGQASSSSNMASDAHSTGGV